MQNWKQKRGTMQHYDLQAVIYNKQYVEEQDVKIGAALKSIKFNSTDFVLDIGCGTGFLFPHINKKVSFLVGAELSLQALKEAKKRTEKKSNIFLVQADADNLPFRDCLFDGAFVVSVLQNIPKPAKTLTEMKRTCKTKAQFVVTGLKKKFTQKDFVNLLESVQLSIFELITNEQLKDFVAVCTTK
jgi:ubiquinone/menaquinone biosynthesis C-methylase UbiE